MMTKKAIVVVGILAGALALVFGVLPLLSADSDGLSAAQPIGDERAQAFRSAVNYGFGSDFNPFTSPAAAVEGSDAVVLGSILRVRGEASRPLSAERSFRYLVLSVEIHEVVSGRVDEGVQELALAFDVSPVAH